MGKRIKRVILMAKSRNKKAKLSSLGVIAGVLLLLLGSMFTADVVGMVLLLAISAAGAFAGIMVIRYLYDMPLPNGYDWSIPSDEGGDEHTANCIDFVKRLCPELESPKYGADGIQKVRELYVAGKFWEVVPAGYSLVTSILEDWLASTQLVSNLHNNRKNSNSCGTEKGGRIVVITKEFERLGFYSAKVAAKRINKIYNKYRELQKGRSDGNHLNSRVRALARDMMDLLSDFLDRKDGSQTA